MTIRQYQPRDRARVISLIRGILAEIFQVEPQLDESTFEDIKKEYLSNGGVFYVAYDHGELIATIGVKRNGIQTVRLKRMYVRKDYRRKKVASKLLERVLDFCNKNGYKKLSLSTYPQMKAALAFYRAKGFRFRRRSQHQFLLERVFAGARNCNGCATDQVKPKSKAL